MLATRRPVAAWLLVGCLVSVAWTTVRAVAATTTSRLVTTLEGGNGSYGVMFDVRALTDVEITRLEFLTDREGADAPLRYAVHERAGGFAGRESDPDAWTAVLSERGVVGQGLDRPTATDSFSVSLRAGETRAFYLSATTSDVRYSLGTEESRVFASDHHLEILEGVGVAGYPFGPYVHRPRVFNGAVEYRATTPPPPTTTTTISDDATTPTERSDTSEETATTTTTPTASPAASDVNRLTLPPTFPPKETTTVVYRFLIRHTSAVSVEDVPHRVDTSLYVKIMELFLDTDKVLNTVYREHGVEFVNVRSTIGNGDDCSLDADTNDDPSQLCSVVTSEILLQHFNTISEEEVRYYAFRYVDEEIAPELEDSSIAFSSVRYVGYRAVETDLLVTLHGTGVDEANKREVVLTEHSVRSFLESRLSASSSPARVAVVEVEEQTVRWRTDDNSNGNNAGIPFDGAEWGTETTFQNKRRPNDSPLHDLRDVNSDPYNNKEQTPNDSPLSKLQFIDDVLRTDDLFRTDDDSDDFVLDDGPDPTVSGLLRGRHAPIDLSEHEHQHDGPSAYLDLSLRITGEYLPPPLVDFSEEVESAFRDDLEDLLFVMRRVPAFANVTRVAVDADRRRSHSAGRVDDLGDGVPVEEGQEEETGERRSDDPDRDADSSLDVVVVGDDGGPRRGERSSSSTSFLGSTLSYVVFGAAGFLAALLVAVAGVGAHHRRRRARRRAANASASVADNQNYIYDIAEEDESQFSESVAHDDSTNDGTILAARGGVAAAHKRDGRVKGPRADFAKHRRFSEAWSRS